MDIVINRTDIAVTKKLFKIRLRMYFRMNYVFVIGMCGIGISLIFSGNSPAFTGAGVTIILFGLMKLINTLQSITKTTAIHDKLTKSLEIHLKDDGVEVISHYLSNRYNWMYFKQYLLKDGNIFIYESNVMNAVSIAQGELSTVQYNELIAKLNMYGILKQ